MRSGEWEVPVPKAYRHISSQQGVTVTFLDIPIDLSCAHTQEFDFKFDSDLGQTDSFLAPCPRDTLLL